MKKAMASKLSPVLAFALAGLWLLLNQTLAAGHIVFGVLLGFGLAGFASALRPLHARLRRLDTAFLLVLVVMRDVVLSNISVARVVFRSVRRGGKAQAAFVRIPLDLRDPHGLAALAAIVTATPGTVWAGLSDSGDALTLHVLDLKDEAQLINLIKERYEQPLRRIFE
jgi:multicomponent K+:H+ antiporter subunit E